MVVYRRFFSEGLVLMYTTAEEPVSCVMHLKYRHAKPGLGIMAGHYRLIGDKVFERFDKQFLTKCAMICPLDGAESVHSSP